MRLDTSKLISHGTSPFIAEPRTFTGNGRSSEYEPTPFASKFVLTHVIVCLSTEILDPAASHVAGNSSHSNGNSDQVPAGSVQIIVTTSSPSAALFHQFHHATASNAS